MITAPEQHPSQWLPIKGIGPWTVAYACMRGLSETDVWLGGDLGIQKALARQHASFDASALSPWRSYATLQLWFGLADSPIAQGE
jgi:AraC family transcriptional regulator of adaptative response / DNA-3-methyladenine glycosylase II